MQTLLSNYSKIKDKIKRNNDLTTKQELKLLRRKIIEDLKDITMIKTYFICFENLSKNMQEGDNKVDGSRGGRKQKKK